MKNQPFPRRLRVRNFRSIRDQVVSLGNPLVLVGRNATGKSNFVRVFSFLSDCATMPLQAAMEKSRGLWNAGTYDWAFTPAPIEVKLEFGPSTQPEKRGFYSLSLQLTSQGDTAVLHEEARLPATDGAVHWFEHHEDRFESNVIGLNLRVTRQSLALPLVGGIEQFSPLVGSLSSMRVYNIEPSRARELDDLAPSAYLDHDGSNLASTMNRLAAGYPQLSSRIDELLSSVMPSELTVKPVRVGQNKLTLVFSQRTGGDAGALGDPVPFDSGNMSDGTLSLLALIVAFTQQPRPSVVAVEEPELNVHPGALGLISDLAEAASADRQVIITTHSPEMLNAKWIGPDNLRIVQWHNGETSISTLAHPSIRALKDHLMSAGELMLANALEAVPPKVASAGAAAQ